MNSEGGIRDAGDFFEGVGDVDQDEYFLDSPAMGKQWTTSNFP